MAKKILQSSFSVLSNESRKPVPFESRDAALKYAKILWRQGETGLDILDPHI